MRAAERKLARHPERTDEWMSNHNRDKDGDVVDFEAFEAELRKRMAQAKLRLECVFALDGSRMQWMKRSE